MLDVGCRTFILVFVAALSSCTRGIEIEPAPGSIPRVRVLLSDNVETVTVSIRGAYEIRGQEGPGGPCTPLGSGVGLDVQTVRCVDADVVVGDSIRSQGSVEFVAQRVPVELNGHRYRGSLLISARQGKLRVINVVDLEGYVRGVVPCEANSGWPAAALEAQAVAARSYALAKMAERGKQSFDVYATQADQVYGGFGRETVRTNDAVRMTVGQVLQYRGRVFTAYYHSCCGGMTADAGRVFDVPSAPLRGSKCGYCTRAPRYQWSKKISIGETAQKLGVNNLFGLRIEDVGPDGRVGQVRVYFCDGSSQAMDASAFRERFGLWSTLFTMRADGSDFVFDGRGWGHGVGLCQWGAKGMADAGKKYQDILERYYPGAKLRRVY